MTAPRILLVAGALVAFAVAGFSVSVAVGWAVAVIEFVARFPA